MTGTAAERRRAPARSGALTEDLVLRLVPLLFLVPVVAALVISVGRLVQVRYPVFGWTLNVDADAQAMALGVWPFQDPSAGYTGNGYTPLFPLLASLPDHLFRWTGWSVMISIAAGAGTAALIARLAWRRPQHRSRGQVLLAGVEAAGIGALAWSLVFGIRQNGLLDARNDQLTWFFALAAIALIPALLRDSTRARVGVVLLVSSAYWVKQPGIAAAVAVGVALLVAALAKRLEWKHLLGMAVASLALNGMLLALLGVLTDGWQLRWNFEINLPATRSAAHAISTLAPRLVPAAVFAVGMGVIVLAGRGRGDWRRRVLSDDGLVAVALLVLATLGAFEGIYLMRFVAGDDNDALALPWALAGLGAIGYRHATAHASTRRAAAGVCVALAATTFLTTGDWRLRRGDVVPAAAYPGLPDDVFRYASKHLVYHPAIPISFLYGREGVYPTALHVREVLNRKLTPSYLVDALVERRFSGVFGFFSPDPTDFVPGALNPGEEYFGWKLNEVIRANYRTVPHPLTIPGGQLTYLSPVRLAMRVPRTGPPALWLKRCFGPFTLGGVAFRIHQGGGFWCRGAAGSIQLRKTVAPASQLESAAPVQGMHGRLDIGVDRAAGWWSIGYVRGWTLRGRVSPQAGVHLTLTAPDGGRRTLVVPADELHRAGGVIHLDVAGRPEAMLERRKREDGAVRVAIPATRPATLAIWTSADLRTRLNFKALRVEGT